MNTIQKTHIDLSLEDIQAIHTESTAWFGGLDLVRDIDMLQSAINAYESCQEDLVEAAVTYLFYLSRNRPFMDNNKRTALCACIVFLRINGLVPRTDRPEWKRLAKAVDSGAMDFEEATAALRELLVY
jgi:death on curing protein